MKPSAVIQGWKSLVDTLNPGLPLTSKESSRLLTALTSSFREQLDEAHPRHAAPATTSGRGSDRSKPQRSAPALQHSSALAADRHLASLLTNPLLNPSTVRTRSDQEAGAHETAIVSETIAQSGIDAISQFEKLTSAAPHVSFEVVRLCANTFHNSLWELSTDEQRRSTVQEQKPGQRMLAWLVRQEQFRTQFLAKNRRFANRLVNYLDCEGRGDLLWSWLAIDDPPLTPNTDERTIISDIPQPQFGRDWLLSYMIDAKLRPPSCQGFNTSRSADAAIDTFLRGVTKRNHALRGMLRPSSWQLSLQLSLRRSARTLVHWLFDPSHGDAFSQTTPRKYDALLDALVHKTGSVSEGEPLIAMCYLVHPNRPDASRGLRLLDRITNPQNPDDDALRESLATLTNLQRRHWCDLLVRCAAIAQSKSSAEDTSLLYAKVERLFPERRVEIIQAKQSTVGREQEDSPRDRHDRDLAKLSFG